LSYYEWQCLSSFPRAGIRVRLHTFDPHLNVPAGVEKADARDLATEEETRRFTQGGRAGSITAFSNLYRYRLLGRAPGWWFDADVFCLGSLDDFERLEATEKDIVVGIEDEWKVNNAVMFCRSTAAAQDLLELANERVASLGTSFPWGTLGPKLLTEFTLKNPDRVEVLSSGMFYPIHFYELPWLFDPASLGTCKARTASALTLHLWNEFIGIYQIPKALAPCEGSYLAELFNSASDPSDRPAALPVGTLEALVKARKPGLAPWEREVLRWARAAAKVLALGKKGPEAGPFRQLMNAPSPAVTR